MKKNSIKNYKFQKMLE